MSPTGVDVRAWNMRRVLGHARGQRTLSTTDAGPQACRDSVTDMTARPAQRRVGEVITTEGAFRLLLGQPLRVSLVVSLCVPRLSPVPLRFGKVHLMVQLVAFLFGYLTCRVGLPPDAMDA